MEWSHQEDYGDLAEINIIPLVDVMLVLLIIFMVAAPLSIGGIKVELPFSQAKSASISEDRIVLTIDNSGQYFIDTSQVPDIQLEDRLKILFRGRKNKELFIRADHKVVYGKVIRAMSAAKVAGVSKLGMLTNQTKKHFRH